ncbi:TetR family transcriptional regulator [Streptomyces sp. NPDC051183]|uniref:TetR/AcrR family transcriptional regulator n=1 Tax=Streptomyces sp. NPDC051183 TaxID=3155165 RepID=UPI003449E3CB
MRADPLDETTGTETGTEAETGTETGLRRRKKEQTRSRLREGAAELFAARGFAGTTVADIAACANVSERTFFRYFDSKEALLLPDMTLLFEYVEAALAARPREEDPLDAICNALLTAAQPFAASTLTALTHPIEGAEPLIAARLVEAFADFEDRLTLLIEQRLPAGTPDADLRAAVIAGAAMSAVRAVLRTRRRRRQAGTDTGADAAPAQLLISSFGILHEIGTTAS